MNWQTNWQDLATGAPIIPYYDVYKDYVQKTLKKNPEAQIVELGIYDGCSARIIYEQMKKYPNSKLFLIDPNIRPLAKELDRPDKNIFLIADKAERVSYAFKVNSIDLLHFDVDGDPEENAHSYEVHLRICREYFPRLKKDSIVIFHDYSDEYDTKQFVDDNIVPHEKYWKVDFIDPHPDSPSTVPVVCTKLKHSGKAYKI
jgi:hypothetical protein